MTRALTGTAIAGAEREFETTSVWDPRSECRLVVARPADEPQLWSAYLAGVYESYAHHGVLEALDYRGIRDGNSTALFFVAVGSDGAVNGGLRTQGPYRVADQAHAMIEWAGQPGERAVGAMIADRIPFGVVEVKAAWVRDGAPQRRALTQTLAQVGVCAAELLDVQFLMASAADHVLELWTSSGGVVAASIPPTPYPDDRYHTRIMWWDRDRRQCRAAAQRFARLWSTPDGEGRAAVRQVGERRDGTA